MKRCPQCNRVETDDTLAFCRADGMALVNGSGSIAGEAGTIKLASGSVSSDVATSILPGQTDAAIARATAPTTVLRSAPIPSPTRGLSKPKHRGVIFGLIALVVAAVAIGGYLNVSRKTTAAIQSIAVMPFVNASGNADLDYLSDGMTETLMSSLSQMPNLNVKARSLVFRYKGKDTNPQTVGRELNVQAILNGRVVQRGADLDLYLELVDASTGNLIWSEQYNRKQADLVSLQSDIARDVSGKLRSKLTGAEKQKLTRNSTGNSEAYKLYLQAHYFAGKRTPKDLAKSIGFYQQAVNIDPNYAMAYVGLGFSYVYLTLFGDAPATETFPKARQFASKAIELDNSLAEPHLLLGLFLFLQDHDLAGWERESKRALELNPNSMEAHRLNGFRLTCLGKFDEAITEIRRALEIEPLSVAASLNYAWTLYHSGRADEAEDEAKRTVELSPNFWIAHSALFNIYRYKKNYALAVKEFATIKELRDETEAAKLIRENFAKGGWKAFLAMVTNEQGKVKSSPYNMAMFYAELGDNDRAFKALDEAVDKCDQFGFIKVDPALESLHDDPRFKLLLRRVGFPE